MPAELYFRNKEGYVTGQWLSLCDRLVQWNFGLLLLLTLGENLL